MTLAELQSAFFSLATGAGGHAAEDLFVGSTELDAASRIGIYADMFVWRQLDCLRDDFPKLATVMGDEAFDALATAYLAEHPSRDPSLAKLGQHLPGFLVRHAGERADLADLATLEWARTEVFDERDARVAAPIVLAELASSGGAMKLIPALRMLRLAHDVARVWQVVEDDQPVPQAQPTRNLVVVWRKDFKVFHVQLQAAEASALERAAAGESLGEICEAFEHLADPFDAAFRTIGSWFIEGWIAEV
jgi:hypothetical protein